MGLQLQSNDLNEIFSRKKNSLASIFQKSNYEFTIKDFNFWFMKMKNEFPENFGNWNFLHSKNQKIMNFKISTLEFQIFKMVIYNFNKDSSNVQTSSFLSINGM